MKKKIIFSTFLVLALTLFSGCTSSSELTGSGKTSKNQTQQPEGQADVSGIVRSMVGNEFVIAKLDLPEGGRKGMMSGKDEKGTEEDKAAVLTLDSTSGMTGGGQGGGPDGGGPGGTTRKDDSDNATTELLRQSTENVTVTIPVGVQIIQGTKALTISDLTSGDMLTIWFDDSVKDRNVAKYVSVR